MPLLVLGTATRAIAAMDQAAQHAARTALLEVCRSGSPIVREDCVEEMLEVAGAGGSQRLGLQVLRLARRLRRSRHHPEANPALSPQTNGKVERFHRTLADGWAYARLYESTEPRNAALPGWLHFYNHHGPTPPSEAGHRSPD